MINVVASIKIKPGTRDQFVAVFNENVPAVLAEDGCIEYAPTIDANSTIDAQAKDADMVTVIEKWESLDALYAHLSAPHMISFREKAGDMIESISLKILKQA